MQRFFDILFSGLALLFLIVPLLIVMAVLRFSGEGEIFYIQQRVGKNGKMFGVYKFATMLKNSATIGTGTVTVKDDPRVLPFGKFLRKSKINELPQLFNILFGSMSIIGPRPQTQRCFDAFPDDMKETILKVTPGLSGIGSIVFRNEEDMMDTAKNPEAFYDDVIMPYKGELEKWFVQNNSLFVYFACIFLTVWVVLTGKGGAVYAAFSTLPKPPESLQDDIMGAH
ncbi:sugar transferase [Fretibacter rubidus]|uniref:sugar transferase n=1 Tax=Fretibacter rubidus TaxID=570162 RepID=UPI00352B3B5C